MGHEQKYILNSTSVLLLFSLSVKILGLNFIPFHKELEIACNSSHEDNNSTLWYNIETEWGFNFNKCPSKLVVPHTGVFACKTENNCSTKNMHDKPCDLHYMFITQSRTGDYKDVNTSTIMLNENQTVTLSCEFNRTNLEFVLFWISDHLNHGYQCLSSVAFVSYDIEINKHCCVSKTIQERINVWNGSLFNDIVQKQYLELKNVTASDSGRYLCFIIYQNNLTLVSNITLQVHETNGATPMSGDIYGQHLTTNCSTPSAFLVPANKQVLYIILGTVGGVFIGIMFLVVYFVRVKGKKKGKKYSDSDATELQGDECIPYAISERRDLEDNLDSMYYAVISSPEKQQAGEKCPKESEVCMFYSVVQVDTAKAL